mmetsp:Transcript_27060/g.76123  ORF Transcript_27060/g.76123 Transcript_27060/m.76123 type:complete len:238 (-) Transcript_27060:248-961(-)
MFVHVHFFWFGRVGMMAELPPVSVLATDDQAVHGGHGAGVGACVVASSSVSCILVVGPPRKVDALGVVGQDVASIGHHRDHVAIQRRRRSVGLLTEIARLEVGLGGHVRLLHLVAEDHQGRDGLQIEQIPHHLGPIQVVRHHIDASHLVAALLEVVFIPIVADEHHLASLVRLEDGGGSLDDGGSKCLAMRTVVCADEDGDVVVKVGIECILGWDHERVLPCLVVAVLLGWAFDVLA